MIPPSEASGAGESARNVAATAAPDATSDAARDAAEAAERQPENAALAMAAAKAMLQAGDHPRAIAFARAAAAAEPDNARAARTLSGILEATGSRTEAIQAGRDAVRLAPSDAEARLHLGNMLAAERNWREAAEQLSAHVTAPGATPTGWRLLSAVLHQAGHAADATEAARRGIEADPNNIEYRLNLTSLLCARGHYDAALEELAVALAQAPANALIWRVLSNVHAALDQLPDALRAAEHAVTLAPADTDCTDNLAYIASLCHVSATQSGDSTRWAIGRRRSVSRIPRHRNSLADDFAVRCRVVGAIVLRDIRTRFGNTRLGYLWAVLEPMSHLATLGTMFYLLNHAPPPVGDNLFLFYITGLVPFLMFSHVSTDIMSAAEGASAVLQLPIVKRTDIMAAHTLRQFATELIVGGITFSLSMILGHQGLPADLLTAGAGVTLLWLLATGIGAINTVVVAFYPSYDTFYNALIRLLYFSSGIYYSPIAMPDMVRDYLVWNPILQGIELFRSGFFHGYEPHWLDVPYLEVWVVVSIGLGFALERAMRARIAVRT